MTSDPVFDYLHGQQRPGQEALMAALLAAGEAGVAALRPDRDVGYGPHPRQVFDFYRQAGASRGALAYFHAGYWQTRDKAQFRAIAPGFVAAGIAVAMVNYPLCPEVTLPALTEAARAAVPAILRHAGAAELAVAGHSAGGHLAVELALTDWRARGLAAGAVRAIAGLSGVYDLEPLLATPLNDKLRLDAASARACSPVLRARPVSVPALFAVGGLETPAFQAQTAGMAAAWAAAGNAAHALTVPEADHFSLIQTLATPGTALWTAVCELFRRA